MNQRTEFVPAEELKADAEASLAKNAAPFSMHIDMTPTLEGNLRYALALHGRPTQEEAVHPSVILRRIDTLVEAAREYPKMIDELMAQKRRVEAVLDEYTFPEIKRRKDVERGGGNDSDDDGPRAA